MSEENEQLTPEQQIEDLEAQLSETKARLLSAEATAAKLRVAHTEAAAEFSKTRDRLKRDQEQEITRARLGMTTNLFELADNLDRTVEAAGNGSGEALEEGVRLVRDQFFKELGRLGLERYSPAGEPFNPNQHEAVGMLTVDKEWLDGAVASVLSPGYRAGDHILRAAIVQVGKYVAPPEQADTSDETGAAAPAGD
jgi:molecular chaperone GrpE